MHQAIVNFIQAQPDARPDTSSKDKSLLRQGGLAAMLPLLTAMPASASVNENMLQVSR